MDLQFFVGREGEMRRLMDALHGAASGEVRLCLLVGAAGIGKTRLAAEFGARAEAEGATVLFGPSHEGESPPPYAAWRLALSQVARSTEAAAGESRSGKAIANMARIVPELIPGTVPRGPRDTLAAADGQYQLYAALTAVLEALSAERALVLVFDDLQWSDPSSLKLLERVAEARLHSRVLIVGTYRDDELPHSDARSQALARVSGTPLCDTIQLEPLPKEQQRQYLNGAGCDPLVLANDAMYERTEGNPLFMVELARTWARSRCDDVPRLPVPRRISALIAARIAGLSAESRNALVHAAVVGREIDLRLLADVLSRRPESLLPLVDEWVAAGIVEEQSERPGRFRFHHAMVQEAILETVGPVHRVSMHAGVAEVLKARVDAGERHRLNPLVHHLIQAVSIVDGGTLAWYARRAAEEALADYAPESALGVLNGAIAALSEWSATKGSHSRLLAELLRCRVRANTELAGVQDAEDDLERAFDIYEELGDIQAACSVALTCIGNTEGSPPVLLRVRSQPLVERALNLLAPGTLEYARLLFCSIPRSKSPDVANEEIFEIARAHGDRALEAMALAREVVVGLARFAPGAIEKAERAIGLAKSEGEDECAAFMTYWLAYNYIVKARASDALRLTGALAAHARRSRSLGWRIIAHYTYGAIYSFTGWWSAACHHAERTLALSPTHTVHFAVVSARHSLAVARMETGALSSNEELVDLLTAGDRREVWSIPLFTILFCRIHEDRSLLQQAAARLRAFAAGIPDLSAPSYVTTHVLLGLSTAAFLLSDPREAAALLPHVEQVQRRSIVKFTAGRPIAAQRALLLAVLGRYDEAFADLDAAASACDEAGYVPALAWTCLYHAEARLRRRAERDVEAARPLLQRAWAAAQPLSMVPLIQRIDRQLAALPSAGTALAEANPDGLTPREVEVLRLVARGYTNKEIGERLYISRHTAATHVQHILDKTGMSNRAEVTAYAANKDLL